MECIWNTTRLGSLYNVLKHIRHQAIICSGICPINIKKKFPFQYRQKFDVLLPEKARQLGRYHHGPEKNGWINF